MTPVRERLVRRWRLLRQAFKIAGADKIFAAYFVFFIVCALAVWVLDPNISRFSDSLWYCFATATTIGFGDITVTAHLSRILSVLLSVYSIGVIAVFTAVITSFFLDEAKSRAADSAKAFLADMERLPEMSREELEDLAERARRFAGGN